MTGLISGIKRMEIHDGEGIRTTVFFKGCPLKCIWCHNPESISFKKQIAFFENKCLGCGACGGLHTSETAPICTGEAIVVFGKEYTAKELLKEVITDLPFYKNSGGGVTLSGGECLAQIDFAVEFSKLLKENGISVFIDTCGFVPFSSFERIIPFTDKFLYDIKAIDPLLHKELTGQENQIILENFKRLVELNCNIEVRYPLVSGYNDNQCEKIGRFLADCGFKGKIKVLKYHSMSGSRYKALNMENTLPDTETTAEHLEAAKQTLISFGLNATIE